MKKITPRPPGQLMLTLMFVVFCKAFAFSQISLVTDLHPGTDGIHSFDMSTKVGNTFYIATLPELIKTDGTASGSMVIKPHWAQQLTSLNTDIYYTDSEKLYKSDGTLSHESSIYEVGDNPYQIDKLLAGQNLIYAIISDFTSGYKVFMTDGTGVVDLDLYISFSSELYVVGDDAYLIGGLEGAATDLYKIENGIVTFIESIEDFEFLYTQARFGATDDNLYFFPTIDTDGDPDYELHFKTEMWKVNDAGNSEVLTSFDSKILGESANVGDYLFFTLESYLISPADPIELWVSDGTTTGTIKIDDDVDPLSYNPGLYPGSSSLYYFKRQGGVKQLWHYDVDQGVKIQLANNLLGNKYFVEGNDIYYFTSGSNGPELWKSDGTLTGTVFLARSDLLRDNNSPYIFGKSNDDLIFMANSQNYGRELFKYSNNDPQCGAHQVVSFNQGKKKDGSMVEGARSNADLALDNPQENNTYNFVALGFGGSVTLEFNPVYDDGTAEPEIILVETSFGKANTPCFSNGRTIYPEEAYAEVSHDGEQWYSLPNSYCRTSFLDIKPAVDQGMPYAKYIRITDASDKSRFHDEADGFDVDGIITCPDEVSLAKERLLNARTQHAKGLYDPEFFNELPNETERSDWKIYPNPIKDDILNIVMQADTDQPVTIKIMDMLGRVKLNETKSIGTGSGTVSINVSSLKKGPYIVTIEAEDLIEIRKVTVLE